MQRQRRTSIARLLGLRLTVFIALATVLSASSALPQDRGGDCRELVLHNGRVTTMDARGTTASAIVIRDDRIALVSTAAGVPPHSPCANWWTSKGAASSRG